MVGEIHRIKSFLYDTIVKSDTSIFNVCKKDPLIPIA